MFLESFSGIQLIIRSRDKKVLLTFQISNYVSDFHKFFMA